MKAETTALDRRVMIDEILDGLHARPKSIPSKYFYDERGSELFEAITRLPEYYLTRTERALLQRWAGVWVRDIGPASIVELGAGNAEKTRWLLEPLRELAPGATYVPMDVSEEFLASTADRLRREYRSLRIVPVAGDFTRPLELPELPEPVLFTLLGSTIGNFDRDQAVEVLAHIRRVMGPNDAFVMGADLRPGRVKSLEILEAAYDDEAGVTAAFNRNVLTVLNRELGSDFDLDAFAHRSFYDADRGRIEMHLVATGRQAITFPGQEPVVVEDGESIRTEISCKYDRESVQDLFSGAGLDLDGWAEDERGYFALVRGSASEG